MKEEKQIDWIGPCYPPLQGSAKFRQYFVNKFGQICTKSYSAQLQFLRSLPIYVAHGHLTLHTHAYSQTEVSIGPVYI